MRVYKTNHGIILESEGSLYASKQDSWDGFFKKDNLYQDLMTELLTTKSLGPVSLLKNMRVVAPIESQEIWAAGVTYTRSRDARMEESKDAGGGSFYDMVYDAIRPELFFKAPSYRCVGPGEKVRIRKDSSWNVPEPELTLAINSFGQIFGYTIGNDMSSRSIEGENPLYLPQAKTYDGSAALGPCLLVLPAPISPDTRIYMEIKRSQSIIFSDAISINKMKRRHTELAEFLFRECSFPSGCFLMTGTCLVPPNDFTLHPGDETIIRIDGIGELINEVA